MTVRAASAVAQYALHGLVVQAPVPLDDQPSCADARPDVVVALEDAREVSHEAPSGTVVIAGDLHGTRLYTGAANGDGVVRLRFHGAAEFELEPNGPHIRGALDPRTDDELGALIVGGTVLAAWMELRGELVLHAGAVERGGRALAVVGASGMGKSTLCAWLCHAGATFVSDDVVRVQQTGGLPPRCYRGSGQVRLRSRAAALAEGLGATTRSTIDGKTALSPARAVGDTLPLSALLVPVPDRAATKVEVEVVSMRQALLALSCFPRVLGWRAPEVLRRRFEALSRLVEDVPVYRATVPWGPPFEPATAHQLLDLVRM